MIEQGVDIYTVKEFLGIGEGVSTRVNQGFPSSNSQSIMSSIFFGVLPLLCGLAGLMSSLKNRTSQTGFYVWALTVVIGLLISILCDPLFIALFWPTVLHSYPVPATQSMWNSPGIWGDQLDGWQQVLPVLLFLGTCAGAIGSGLGWGLALAMREESPTHE